MLKSEQAQGTAHREYATPADQISEESAEWRRDGGNGHTGEDDGEGLGKSHINGEAVIPQG
ncbi:hypothetical protein [Deinococcus hopiensis]|uniref:hypothetical protein n=1 Tax=Deinococcus hopiensis TaxID=309885 RepID=UPI000A0667D3|nr:hypothetical protein [Deinococcus hopiensis]